MPIGVQKDAVIISPLPGLTVEILNEEVLVSLLRVPLPLVRRCEMTYEV